MRKYTELLTIPAAFLVLLVWYFIGFLFGLDLYPIESVQKIFIGFFLFLIIIGLARIVFKFQFPQLYRFIDDDFNENKAWNVLEPKEKAWAGLGLFSLFCLLLTLLVANL